MDGVFLIALIVFAAASAALLRLCDALGSQAPDAGTQHGGVHNHAVPGKHSAADRGL
ncbi:hypothetical protein [Cupriavidus numazuensis]|uniref:Uncharacterized protein n=1 Tax=Cupriavidus numazuensis TaxID=221992 RepID=A0ABN7QFL8_9BURK|nr:hypothetical protein [Cupriavidus numazuensis]CAG2159398.1 hypothetical protein LMG26411_06671 [Cupriavidus numazuensis]